MGFFFFLDFPGFSLLSFVRVWGRGGASQEARISLHARWRLARSRASSAAAVRKHTPFSPDVPLLALPTATVFTGQSCAVCGVYFPH